MGIPRSLYIPLTLFTFALWMGSTPCFAEDLLEEQEPSKNLTHIPKDIFGTIFDRLDRETRKNVFLVSRELYKKAWESRRCFTIWDYPLEPEADSFFKTIFPNGVLNNTNQCDVELGHRADRGWNLENVFAHYLPKISIQMLTVSSSIEWKNAFHVLEQHVAKAIALPANISPEKQPEIAFAAGFLSQLTIVT